MEPSVRTEDRLFAYFYTLELAGFYDRYSWLILPEDANPLVWIPLIGFKYLLPNGLVARTILSGKGEEALELLESGKP